MRRSTPKMATLFVALLAACLVVAGGFRPHRSQAAARMSDQSRLDVQAKLKSPPPAPRIINGDAPINDNCANAIAVSACPFTDSRSTDGATVEPGEPSGCSSNEATVWYTYTNASSHPVILTVSLCNSNFDSVLAVYKANGGPCDFASFVEVACSDDTLTCGGSVQPVVTFAADPGATYKIQAGGFFGETGHLSIQVDCESSLCGPVVVNGVLGSGDPNFAGKQFSGLQLDRLARDGTASICAVPKTCQILNQEGLRHFDAYAFPNDSSQAACVSINLNVTDQMGCNLQSNAYLDTYDPNNICTSYLGDPGSSSGSNPPNPTNMTVVVPAGHTLIVVVQTVNLDESGCHYTLTVTGSLCFDTCVQDDRNPSRFVLFSRFNGDYEYHDCSKGVVIKGRGVVSLASPPGNCKFTIDDSGPMPKRPDRAVHIEGNVCTFVANATIRFPLSSKTAATLADGNYTNNDCVCH